MRKQERKELDRCCQNCTFFLQHYIRVPDDEDSVTFIKCALGDCLVSHKKLRKPTDKCSEYREFEPGLLEKIMLSEQD